MNVHEQLEQRIEARKKAVEQVLPILETPHITHLKEQISQQQKQQQQPGKGKNSKAGGRKKKGEKESKEVIDIDDNEIVDVFAFKDGSESSSSSFTFFRDISLFRSSLIILMSPFFY
jgi:hypothetical protein